MNKPLISVIMPAYNCEKTVAIAIDSLLRQTYSNIEIIVVDDKSEDKTKDVVRAIAARESRVRLIDGHHDPKRYDAKLKRNVNAGWSARNAGLEIAKGEYVTFQDADDASLLNRIEMQYELLKKHDSTHLCIDWVMFNENLLNKSLAMPSEQGFAPETIGPDELYIMARRSKGLMAKISKHLNAATPFHIKRMRGINRLFFGSLENYPGPGNSPMFKREVIEKVKFRHLKNRIWPSFMGRGADRDFNFQVAETFRNSHVCLVPLYLWRVPNENARYKDGIEPYIIK